MRRWYERHREEYLRRQHEIVKVPKVYKTKWSAQKLKEFVESHGYLLKESDTWEYSPGCSFHIAKKSFPEITREIRLNRFQSLVKS
jgi:hypothetical protein